MWPRGDTGAKTDHIDALDRRPPRRALRHQPKSHEGYTPLPAVAWPRSS